MYRTNFPDAPRPYANAKRHSPSIKEHLRASWLTSVIGFIMFLAGMKLVYWNEGQAVQTAHSLEEAMNAVIPVKYTSVIMEENNGKLVHFSGTLRVGEPLAEVEYGVAVPAVKLKRRVQMYQWVEEKHKREFPLKTTVYVNERVSVGRYMFGAALIDKFSDFVLVTSDERPERRDIKLHAGLYYHSRDVWNPEVGDIRVQFSYAGRADEEVSVVGMQVGKEIQPYRTFSGNEILMLRHGRLTVEEMFLDEQARNQWLTWAYRALGWLMMFLGANCVSNILQIIVSRYSILRSLLLMGMNFVNMAISTSVCFLVMSLAWSSYRPVLGTLLVIGGAMPFLFSAVRLYRRERESRYQRL
ncbi:transmembrane protein 43 homolog isoform X2 [Zootermopsis nevadensis]|uniref:transmembrane protein 43 homolog isoform X2 n=1 Tax=Zootermopsis nevadensis TaxID=136037 RepID=UPI000B8E770C|nr:transmembrane protein 43 homolog isoform X2 [Zootermopsis nevadensis]